MSGGFNGNFHEVAKDDDDTLEACDEDFTTDATNDEHLDGVVLFADVDPQDEAAIAARIDEYDKLFNA